MRASMDSDCWVHAKFANVVVPIAEFEHVFLQARAAARVFEYSMQSPLDLLEGADDSGAPFAQLDKTYYARRRWHLCPANATCGLVP